MLYKLSFFYFSNLPYYRNSFVPKLETKSLHVFLKLTTRVSDSPYWWFDSPIESDFQIYDSIFPHQCIHMFSWCHEQSAVHTQTKRHTQVIVLEICPLCKKKKNNIYCKVSNIRRTLVGN